MLISSLNNFYRASTPFCAVKPFYAINKDAELSLFTSRTQAAQTLGISDSSIRLCLNGKQNISHNHIFVNAEDLLSTDEDGNKVIDPVKLNFAMLKFDTNPVYAIQEDGNYKRYHSIREAQDDIGCSQGQISRNINNKDKVTYGYVFKPSSEIEIIDENGEIHVDKDLLKKAMLKFDKSPLYVINGDGTYERYRSRKEAAENIFTSLQNIAVKLFRQTTSNDQIFVNAGEIETIDDDGTIHADKEKISEYVKKINSK